MLLCRVLQQPHFHMKRSWGPETVPPALVIQHVGTGPGLSVPRAWCTHILAPEQLLKRLLSQVQAFFSAGGSSPNSRFGERFALLRKDT